MNALLQDKWIRALGWITVVLVIGVVIYETLPVKKFFTESFVDANGVCASDDTMALSDIQSPFWSKMISRRGDVGPELEVSGLKRDNKYFSGYANIQRFGQKTDFCRMVIKDNDKFFACALGGTDNTSSISFRTQSVNEGLILSRDDYVSDTNGDGRDDYCRILRNSVGGFDAQCNLSTDTGFDTELVLDPNPPDNIVLLLQFYQGIMLWLRFYDDMLDYAGNLVVNVAGKAGVIENPPRPITTKGLHLNGLSQYLRIGDNTRLQFGNKVLLRSMRSFCFWVKFDEFTNNAHVFDFGNGSGNDNVFVGILGTGNSGVDTRVLPSICDSTLPASPSGQQPEFEVSPQTLMKTTCANVDDFECKAMSVPAVPPPNSHGTMNIQEEEGGISETCNMIYEIWEKGQRKMHIVIPKMFKKGTWTHVTVTAANNNAFRPDIHIYNNGVLVYTELNGWLPTVSKTSKNFIGRSNWADASSQFSNRDELFKGSLFDLRLYNVMMGKKLIHDTVNWGQKKLGLPCKNF